MAFTDHSDLFGAVHEQGINRVVQHVMRQRPSLFNYATAFFREHNDLLCVRIAADKKVLAANNPLFDIQDPVPVLGTPIPIGLNWCLQLTNLEIDFHPGSAFQLPPELGEIPPQRMALHIKACFGLDCPSEEFINEILPQIEVLATNEDKQQPSPFGSTTHVPPRSNEPRDPIVLPTEKLRCFCLELFAVAHFEWGTIGNLPQQWLKVRLDGLEIVDLQPTPMEDTIECYVKTVLRLGILPRLSLKIEKLVLDITKLMQEQGIEVGQQISLQPAPVPAAVPNNPAIEEDQLKVFINLIVEEI